MEMDTNNNTTVEVECPLIIETKCPLSFCSRVLLNQEDMLKHAREDHYVVVHNNRALVADTFEDLCQITQNFIVGLCFEDYNGDPVIVLFYKIYRMLEEMKTCASGFDKKSIENFQHSLVFHTFMNYQGDQLATMFFEFYKDLKERKVRS